MRRRIRSKRRQSWNIRIFYETGQTEISIFRGVQNEAGEKEREKWGKWRGGWGVWKRAWSEVIGWDGEAWKWKWGYWELGKSQLTRVRVLTFDNFTLIKNFMI